MTIKVICVVAVSGALAMTTHDRARDGGLSASVRGHGLFGDIGHAIGSFFGNPMKTVVNDGGDVLCDADGACDIAKTIADETAQHITNSIPSSPIPSSQAVDLSKFPLKTQQAYAMVIQVILINRLKHASPNDPGSEVIAGAINQILKSLFDKQSFPITNLLGVNLPTNQAELKSKIPQGMSHNLAYKVWTLYYASHGQLGLLADILQSPTHSVSAQAIPSTGGSELFGSSYYDMSGWERFTSACANIYRRIIRFFQGGQAGELGGEAQLAIAEQSAVLEIAQNSIVVDEAELVKSVIERANDDSLANNSEYDLNSEFISWSDIEVKGEFNYGGTLEEQFGAICQRFPEAGQSMSDSLSDISDVLENLGRTVE